MTQTHDQHKEAERPAKRPLPNGEKFLILGKKSFAGRMTEHIAPVRPSQFPGGDCARLNARTILHPIRCLAGRHAPITR